jgi:hypothetical protein
MHAIRIEIKLDENAPEPSPMLIAHLTHRRSKVGNVTIVAARYLHLAVDRVVRVDDAVVVAVVLRPRTEPGIVLPAHQLIDVLDLPARVLEHQNPGARLGPAGVDGKAGALHVEHRRDIGLAGEVDAVAGQIQHQRVVVAREERMAEANERDLVAELEDGRDLLAGTT